MIFLVVSAWRDVGQPRAGSPRPPSPRPPFLHPSVHSSIDQPWYGRGREGKQHPHSTSALRKSQRAEGGGGLAVVCNCCCCCRGWKQAPGCVGGAYRNRIIVTAIAATATISSSVVAGIVSSTSTTTANPAVEAAEAARQQRQSRRASPRPEPLVRMRWMTWHYMTWYGAAR